MKILFVVFLTFLIVFCFNYLFAKTELAGKELFYTIKGKYGACNHCHRDGNSAGRWNFEYEEIDPDDGRKIPSLKGVGKRKDHDQIQRSIKLMEKLFGFKPTDKQRSQLAEYVGTL